MKKITRSDLIRMLAFRTDTTKAQAEIFLDAFVGEVAETVNHGGTVSISGFGRFEMRKRKQRRFVNPKTGYESILPVRYKPAFSFGSKFRKEMTSNG